MKVDGSRQVAHPGYRDVQICEQLNFAPRDADIHAELARGRGEILLENLKRHHAGSGPAMLRHQIESAALLRRG
ncbi:MAG TPA: hypothetical protein VGZ29_02160 [Terriglobia bacterium]|nr:hypothetical protein [Terriglobia bacterium]